MDSIESRLAAAGLILPSPMSPVATYVPSVLAGGLLHISGQGPVRDGKFMSRGFLGRELTTADGIEAARLTALNLLAQAKAAVGGDLGRIARCVKLFGLAQSAADFTDHATVMAGAAEAMHIAFGAYPALTAIGAAALPFDTSVEIDAVFAMA